MKLSILILTMDNRVTFFERLRHILEPQLTEECEVVVIRGDDATVGEKRNRAIYEAAGEYVVFIDDDDTVPVDYVETLLPYLDGINDYVGFQVQCYRDGLALKPTYHNYDYNSWWEDANGYYRHVSHLNPIKRDIALAVPFEYSNYGEDHVWASTLKFSKLIEHHAYIDKVMYHYWWRTQK
jgi:glycosyltransferase involved in cell wall biosynthesis